jgi:hypothetical protein
MGAHFYVPPEVPAARKNRAFRSNLLPPAGGKSISAAIPCAEEKFPLKTVR